MNKVCHQQNVNVHKKLSMSVMSIVKIVMAITSVKIVMAIMSIVKIVMAVMSIIKTIDLENIHFSFNHAMKKTSVP